MEENQNSPNRKVLFNFIGAFSAISLVLVAINFLPSLITGNLSVLREFFEENRGIEPFVIFIFPVILIAGSAWIWKEVKLFKK